MGQKVTFFLLIGLFIIPCLSLSNDQFSIWGPVSFERTTGQPDFESVFFDVPDSTWEYELVVQTGLDNSPPVRSARIIINDELVVSPDEFNQQTTKIIKDISLKMNNRISVRVAGIPGSFVEITVNGPSHSTVIPADGGSVILDNIATVIFKSGVFSDSAEIAISVSSSPETQADYEFAEDLFMAGIHLAYEFRINTGYSEPMEDCQFIVNLPDSFTDILSDTLEIQLFAQVLQSDGMELIDVFEIFPSAYDPITNELSVDLPAYVFTDERTSSGFEAICIIGTTPALSPESLNLIKDADICNGLGLQHPLIGETYTDGRGFNISNDVNHHGIDYKAIEGTPVHASADGYIRRIRIPMDIKSVDYTGGLCPKPHEIDGKPKCTRGYGLYVVIVHGKPGDEKAPTTLYAHLKDSSTDHIKVGQKVKKGDIIGKVDNTGGSTGNHLHFEYAPNGKTYKKTGKVDPNKCMSTDLPEIEIVQIRPTSNIKGGDNIRPSVYLESDTTEFPTGTEVEFFVSGASVGKKSITGPGYVSSPYSKRLPNLWKNRTDSIQIKITCANQMVAESTYIFDAPYGWTNINRGPWEVTYSLDRLWENLSNPSDIRTTSYSGDGTVGSYSYYTADFTETWERTGCCIPPFSIMTHDDIGCTYVAIGPYGNDTLIAEIQHRSCFWTQILPDDYFLETSLLFGWIMMPDVGYYEFEGPYGEGDHITSSLTFRRQGDNDYPLFSCDRIYEYGKTTSNPPYKAKLEFNGIFERIPIGGWESEIVQSQKQQDTNDMQNSNNSELIVSDIKNSPNPFNPFTEINFTLNQSSYIHLDIYNILGQRVTTLVDNFLEAGSHTVDWDGTDLYGYQVSSGVYIYKIQTNETNVTKKMLLIR